MNEMTAIDEDCLLETTEGGVRRLILNRPAQRNPLSLAMLTALGEALRRAAEDPGVRVIVISAAGPVFSAGHDLREMGRQPGESLGEQQRRMRGILELCSSMMLHILRSPRAVIASVQGTATAAGCQLVSACDLAIAADSARFCTPGVNLGGFCTTPLVGIGRAIHRKHAMAMALTGEMISAEEALSFGLINEVAPAAELETRTMAVAGHIASRSAQGIREGKADFYRQVEMPVEEAFAFANNAMVRAMTSPDAQEGNAAFFEKRKPQWGDA